MARRRQRMSPYCSSPIRDSKSITCSRPSLDGKNRNCGREIMNRNGMLLAPAVAAMLFAPAGAQVPTGASLGALGQPGPQVLRADYARTRAVISPIIHADHRITFKLNAPEANNVRLTGHVIGPNAHWLSKDRSLPMTKGADGIWSITMGPLKPDIYDYGYTVDGAGVSDPGNRLNLVEVPGDAPSYYDAKDVPHGDVHMVVYHSKAIGSTRYLRVYTPPDYETGKQRYPVLYLMHG